MMFVEVFYQGPNFIISEYEGDYALENGKVCRVEKWMADILFQKGYAKKQKISRVCRFRWEERGREMYCIKDVLRNSEARMIGFMPANLKGLILGVKKKVGHKGIENKNEDE